MIRGAALAVAILGTAFATSAQAKVTPQIVDPKGDAKGMQAGTDIESVTFAPIRAGRTVTGLTVTMALGAPPVRQPGVLYRVSGDHSGCGSFQISSAATLGPVEQNSVYMTCGTSPSAAGGGTYTIVDVSPKTIGSSLVWTLKLRMLPKEMRKGTMSDLQAFVAMAEPVFGIANTADFVPETAIDHAVGDRTFKY